MFLIKFDKHLVKFSSRTSVRYSSFSFWKLRIPHSTFVDTMYIFLDNWTHVLPINVMFHCHHACMDMFAKGCLFDLFFYTFNMFSFLREIYCDYCYIHLIVKESRYFQRRCSALVKMRNFNNWRSHIYVANRDCVRILPDVYRNLINWKF